MRIVFDNLPGTFKEKLKKYDKLISEWKNKEISGGFIRCVGTEVYSFG